MLECSDPGRVKDSDIPAYLAGEARASFVEHLAKCAFCRAETELYRQMEGKFSSHLSLRRAATRVNCPDSQLLGEFALKLLSGSDKKKVETHLKSCNFCVQEYNYLKAELELPDEFMVPIITESFGNKLRRVLATLRPAPQPRLALRGVERPVSLDYETEGVNITVTLQPSRQKKALMTLSGSAVFTGDSVGELEGAPVTLMENHHSLASENLDDTGSFFFDNVPNLSSFTLEIQLKDRIVVIPVEVK
jgi:hypothetical protein